MKVNGKLGIEAVNLKVNRSIIIDSVNNNSFEWQVAKSVEELADLQVNLLRFRNNSAANEHVCKEIAHAYIQLAILTEMFGVANIQLFIEERLDHMNSKNKKLRKKGKIGFGQ